MVMAIDVTYKELLDDFQVFAGNVVDKYCSIVLPYKPGLYSIYWESMYRITGLHNELHAAATKILDNNGNANLVKQLENIIYHSLLRYLEKIYGADYPDAEQPEWMLQIAHRLQLYTPLRSNA